MSLNLPDPLQAFDTPDASKPSGNPYVEDATDSENNYFQEDAYLLSNLGAPSISQGSPGILTGITGYEAFAQMEKGLDDGSVLNAVSGGVGYALDILSFATDPIGYVAGQLFSWMLEHVEPLRQVLDYLGGNPTMIKAYAQSWTNIQEAMQAIQSDFGEKIATMSSWVGETAQAYRERVAAVQAQMGASGEAAGAINKLMLQVAEIVGGIRTAVRDTLSWLAGCLVGYAIKIAATVGTGTPLVIAQALMDITKAGVKVAEMLGILGKVISKAGVVLVVIRDLLDGIAKAAVVE